MGNARADPRAIVGVSDETLASTEDCKVIRESPFERGWPSSIGECQEWEDPERQKIATRGA